MTKLDEMWVKLEKYQGKADELGHGDTWAEMCRLRTAGAARDARDATDADAIGDYRAQKAIDAINKATGETE